MAFTFFTYKGFNFIAGESELAIYRNGNLIALHPINPMIMDCYDIVEVIDEILEM